MNLITDNIDTEVTKYLSKTKSATIAVAYFNPNDELLKILKTISKLEIIVSDDFRITNPYKLETLKNNASIHCISTEDNGLFHAKIVICKLMDNTTWGLLGSANFTNGGLSLNNEACIELSSKNSEDKHLFPNMDYWLNSLNKKEINFDSARKIWDNRPRALTKQTNLKSESDTYYAIKTTAGDTGISYWDDFQAEGVIAIGWTDLANMYIKFDPQNITKEEIRNKVKKVYPKESSTQQGIMADSIYKFFNIKPQSTVLICKGYNANQKVPVYVHAIAKTTGPAYLDKNSSWWMFKIPTDIQVINTYIPIDNIKTDINHGSLRKTIHILDHENLLKLCARLKNEYSLDISI